MASRLISAEGRTLTVAEWARRLRCSRVTIQTRLSRGWTEQAAVTVPVETKDRPITANGRTLPVTEWARRLHTTPHVIGERLARGWTEQAAVTTPVVSKEHERPITIDGVTMNVAEWTARMGLPKNRIYARLSLGWSEKEAVFGRANPDEHHLITAAGQTKYLSEWARDLGCTPSVIQSRLSRGWSDEEAVTIPVGTPRPRPPRGVCARVITARGQSKTVQEWADELGCHVGTITHRLSAGWTEEEAVTRPADRSVQRRSHWVTANGQTKPLSQWAEELGLLPSTVLQRIGVGWPEDLAVTLPPQTCLGKRGPVPQTLTINGRTRTLSEWAADAGIGWWTLYGRLRRGWSPEDAVGLPRQSRVGRRGHSRRSG